MYYIGTIHTYNNNNKKKQIDWQTERRDYRYRIAAFVQLTVRGLRRNVKKIKIKSGHSARG